MNYIIIGVSFVALINLVDSGGAHTLHEFDDTNDCFCSINYIEKRSATNVSKRFTNCLCNGEHYYFVYTGEPIATTINHCNDYCRAKSSLVNCPRDLSYMLPVCPPYWVRFGQKCYYSPPDSRVSWDNAHQVCQKLSARVLKIESPEENDFVEGYMRGLSGLRVVWLDAKHSLETNITRWRDGSPVKYTNWQPGQPGGYGPCVNIVGRGAYTHAGWVDHKAGVWDDVPCGQQFLTICETNATIYSEEIYNYIVK